MLPAAVSGGELALAIGVPAAVVVGGAVALLRGRARRGSASAPGAPPPAATRAAAQEPPVATATAVLERGEAPGPAAAPAGSAPPVEAVEEAAPVEEAVEAPTYRGRLGRARGFLGQYLTAVRARGRIDAETWEELEEALIRADVGVAGTDALLADLRARTKAGEFADADALLDALKGDLVAALDAPDRALAGVSPREAGVPGADVWLFVGVNGVGKTTTIGKVATRLIGGGHKVLLAAGDTFRAAAGEQLAQWADRAGAEIVRGAEGGDPSAIVFDAVQRAAARGDEVVLADTAGRLHNKANLIEELKKIRRVAGREPGTVTEVLLVLDATTGQNGLQQAKVFLEAVAVTGVVLTKLDGTAKGGIVIAIQRELGLPVKLVGLGEGAADLVDFDPAAFVDALF